MISPAFPWPQAATQRRLAAGVSIVLVIALLWMLAETFWLFASPAREQVPVQSGAPGVNVQPPVASADLGRYHLFGEYQVNATVAAYHDAPETALNLELRGIVSTADPESGFAIIVAGGRQAAYDVGQEVPGGAEVRGIYADRVVLFHAGRYETLRLPVERSGAPDVADAEPPGYPVAPVRPAAANIAGWRDQLSINLESRGQYSLIPVKEGGYRLFLSRDAQQLTELGMRNGDVIRSANGIPLNSRSDVEQVIAKVLSGETLTLLVVRDGAEMSLTPDIEHFVTGVR